MSASWLIGFSAAAIVVVIVAILLLYILAQAMRIRRLALIARDVVGEIEKNTKPIWQLNRTAAGGAALEHTAREIEAAGGAIAGALAEAGRRNAA